MTRGAELDSPGTLIVGRGRLARAFAFLLPEARVVGRDELDISDPDAVRRVLDRLRPGCVINCAAMTDMARCEAQPEAAWAVNVEGVRHLADLGREIGATTVHFSSDYALEPVNEYARTKLASEAFADLTIRAKIYDASHWAWQALREGRAIQMTTREFANPVTTTAVASAAIDLVRSGARGVYFHGTAERMSLRDIGRAWARVLGAAPELVQAVEQVPSRLPRLAEMYLPTDAIASRGVRVLTLEEDAREHRELHARYATMAARRSTIEERPPCPS